MSVIEAIEQDYLRAYKAREEQRVGVLRLLKTAAKNRQVELLRPLNDDEMLDVIQKQAKQRQDSIEQFTAANRKDLADREAAELEILRGYLPTPLTAEELAAAVEAAVAETGAEGMPAMGKVMTALMAACKGRVDGKAASEAVKARLLRK